MVPVAALAGAQEEVLAVALGAVPVEVVVLAVAREEVLAVVLVAAREVAPE